MKKKPNYFNISVVIWALFICFVLFYKGCARADTAMEYDTISYSTDSISKNDVEYNVVEASVEEIQAKEVAEPLSYYITSDDRECLAYIIAGETGAEPIEGKMAVAQCLLNAMRQDGLSAEEVREKYQYAGWKTNLEEVDPENWQQVLDAIERVFDNGEIVTDENILYFYAPKYCTSKWHETQKYVGTWGTQRFFAPHD